MVTIIAGRPVVVGGVQPQLIRNSVEYDWCKKLLANVSPESATSIQKTQLTQCVVDHPTLDPAVAVVHDGVGWIIGALVITFILSLFIPFLPD